MTLQNRVRDVRRERRLTQQQLAERAAVTRQTVSAVEGGGMQPSVLVALQLARALDCSVEELFSLQGEEPVRLAETPPRQGPWPVRLSRLDHTLWAWPIAAGGPLQAADAIWAPDRPLERLTTHPPEQTLVLLGCHPGLHVLEGYLSRRSDGAAAVIRERNSRDALRGLAEGKAHGAGIHLRDPEGHSYNRTAARGSLEVEGGFLVHFARWEEGLCFRPDGPQIRSLGDLLRHPMRILEREEGSEAFLLLRRQLAAAGIDPAGLPRGGVTARSHAQVAQAVRESLADAGVTVRFEAEARCLSFLPLAEESFDLLIPSRLFETRPVQEMFGVLTDARFRQELALLGSDASRAGTVLWSG